jgi:hypothetical protein
MEACKDVNSKADKQLSTLNFTLKNMIRTSRETSVPVQVGLSGFYEAISKSIKRK